MLKAQSCMSAVFGLCRCVFHNSNLSKVLKDFLQMRISSGITSKRSSKGSKEHDIWFGHKMRESYLKLNSIKAGRVYLKKILYGCL